MARTDTLGHFLTDVADAIREKKGTTGLIQASDFDTEIESITTGGGYSITVNVINGTYTGAETTADDNEAFIYITPDTGKTLIKNDITVVGASFTYTKSTKTIKLYNPTGDITVSAECKVQEYEAVEYIEATGTQYIVSDYVPNQNTRIEMKMNKPSWHEQWDSMWGSENKFTFMQYGWNITNKQLQLEMWGSSQGTGIDIQFNTDVEVILDASIPLFQYGNYTYTPSFGSQSPTGVMIIFGKRQTGTTSMDHLSNYKLYYFKIYENGTLVRNYMPALDNNSVPCLYETVNKTYVYNSGSGTFNYE